MNNLNLQQGMFQQARYIAQTLSLSFNQTHVSYDALTNKIDIDFQNQQVDEDQLVSQQGTNHIIYFDSANTFSRKIFLDLDSSYFLNNSLNWAQLNFNQIQGTITNAQIPDGEINIIKLLGGNANEIILMNGSTVEWGKITNNNVDNNAQIHYDKLNLNNSIVDQDIQNVNQNKLISTASVYGILRFDNLNNRYLTVLGIEDNNYILSGNAIIDNKYGVICTDNNGFMDYNRNINNYIDDSTIAQSKIINLTSDLSQINSDISGKVDKFLIGNTSIVSTQQLLVQADYLGTNVGESQALILKCNNFGFGYDSAGNLYQYNSFKWTYPFLNLTGQILNADIVSIDEAKITSDNGTLHLNYYDASNVLQQLTIDNSGTKYLRDDMTWQTVSGSGPNFDTSPIENRMLVYNYANLQVEYTRTSLDNYLDQGAIHIYKINSGYSPASGVKVIPLQSSGLAYGQTYIESSTFTNQYWDSNFVKRQIDMTHIANRSFSNITGTIANSQISNYTVETVKIKFGTHTSFFDDAGRNFRYLNVGYNNGWENYCWLLNYDSYSSGSACNAIGFSRPNNNNTTKEIQFQTVSNGSICSFYHQTPIAFRYRCSDYSFASTSTLKAYIASTGQYNYVCDKNTKENICENVTEICQECILNLKFYDYNKIGFPNLKEINSVLAQDFLQCQDKCIEFVVTIEDQYNGLVTISTQSMVHLSLKICKQQQECICKMQQQIQQLEDQYAIDQQDNQNTSLRNSIADLQKQQIKQQIIIDEQQESIQLLEYKIQDYEKVLDIYSKKIDYYEADLQQRLQDINKMDLALKDQQDQISVLQNIINIMIKQPQMEKYLQTYSI